MAISIATRLFGGDASFSPLTNKDAVEIKQKLEGFEKGQVTLGNITDNPEWSLKCIEYYVIHTNEVTVKMKLPIAKSFAVWSKYPEGAKLAQDYVNVYSNDWHGWRVLGGCKLMMGLNDDGLNALINAARLGDDGNYAALGLAALKAGRLDVFETIALPHLFIAMNDTQRFPENERIQMKGIVIAYSLKTAKKDIFLKTIATIDFNTIYKWKDLNDLIVSGCERFEGSDIEVIRRKLGSALSNDSASGNTNSPPK